MKNIKKFIVILSLLFVGFIASWFYLFRIIQPPLELSSEDQELLVQNENADSEKTVNLFVDFGNGEVQTLEKTVNNEEKLTVFGILEKFAEEEGVELESQQYDFGVFVKSIAGYEGSAETAWIFFVNGESGQVSADQYELKNGDVVEWKYLEPSVSD